MPNLTNPTAIIAAVATVAIAGIVLIATVGNDVPPSLEQALYVLVAGIVGGSVGAGVTAAQADARAKKDAVLRAAWRSGTHPDDAA